MKKQLYSAKSYSKIFTCSLHGTAANWQPCCKTFVCSTIRDGLSDLGQEARSAGSISVPMIMAYSSRSLNSVGWPWVDSRRPCTFINTCEKLVVSRINVEEHIACLINIDKCKLILFRSHIE